MSTLSRLAASEDSRALPGYVLSPLNLSDYGQCEREFELDSLARAAATAAHLPPEVAVDLMARTQKIIDDGGFGWGTIRFDNSMLKLQSVPLLLYLSLKKRHPEVTRDSVVKIWIESENKGALHNALLDIAGYPRVTDKKGVLPEQTVPSTSEVSSGSSESTTSEAPPSTTSSLVA